MLYKNIREEELKNKIAEDIFGNFDCTKIIGDVDFCVTDKRNEDINYLWAEAKKDDYDIYAMFVQLILTIGKARTFDKFHPPSYLGVFDSLKFAFIPYYQIQDFFYQNDFNWKVAPSDNTTKEFKEVYEKVKNVIDADSLIFRYDNELKDFIRTIFLEANTDYNKIQIDKNNFLSIYIRWRNDVMPSIYVEWDEAKKEKIVDADFYEVKNIGTKTFYCYDDTQKITEWISNFDVKNKENIIGFTGNNGPDFQNNNYCHINTIQKINKNGTLNNATKYTITANNLIQICIYFAVRKVIKSTWLNDRDQFLYPNDNWEKDTEFKNDCLAYTLFHGKNNIQSQFGTNHWIPFIEKEVDAQGLFDSNFMSDFITGKIKINNGNGIYNKGTIKSPRREFSLEATSVFDAGRELWKYYHLTANNNPLSEYNINASLYDIKEYFQGRNDGGRLNTKSKDEKYNELITNIRDVLDILAQKIEPKIYEYEFLLK